jgi:simple sugar transport system permease protein
VSRLLRSAARALAPIVAAALCLALSALVLAWLPSRDEETATVTFRDRLRLIAQVTYERVLLPRPPTMDEGYRNWILTLQRATPILLTGLAVAAAFRAGVLNIGAQGQLVLGAIAATAVGVYWNAPPTLAIPALLLAAIAAGAIFASVAAALEQWRGVPVVLSTLLLNFVALEFLRYLLQGPMRARSEGGTLLDPQSPEMRQAARLPEFFAQNPGQGLHLGFFIALIAAALLAFVLRKTTFGFRLRAVGQNPDAARFAGMSVGRVAAATLALSGALAGLAGGVQVAGVTPYILYPDLGTSAMGFTGIAVALLGQLSAPGVVLAAVFFGLLDTAFRALEREMGISAVAAQAVQGALVIAMLVLTSPVWLRKLQQAFPRRSKPAAEL